MSRIHRFQRYSQKENVITNNTLLLLSQLYSQSPLRFESFLAELLDPPYDLEVGVSFQQQTSLTDRSIPDANVSQPSLCLIVETKRGSEASRQQISRHLTQFQQEDQQVFLLLLGGKPETSLEKEFEAIVEEHNRETPGPGVVGRICTFREIIDSAENNVEDHEMDLVDLVEDYEDFCAEMDLLPRGAVRMRAVPCGKTLEDNFEFDLYWERGERASRDYKYLGIYGDKAIRGVGEVANRVTARMEDCELAIEDARAEVSDDEELRILGAMRARPGLRSGYDFVLVDEFIRTDYRKESKYGMRGMQYFDLAELLGKETSELGSAEEIAEDLREKTW